MIDTRTLESEAQSARLAALRHAIWEGENKYKLVLAALVLIYIGVMTRAQFLKFDSYGMGYDLGLYEQVIWNTSHGRLFVTSNFKYMNVHLGADVIPLELLIAVPYALAPSPYTLLFLETLAVALGAIPLYWLARDKLGSAAAVLICFAYFIYVPLHFLNLYEFQPRAFAVGLVFALFYFFEKDRFIPFIISGLLLLTTRSDVALLLVVVGLYAFYKKKPLHFALTPLVLGIVWFVLAFFVIVPYFNSNGRFQYLSFYGYLGNTPAEIVRTMLTRPLLVIQSMTTQAKLAFLRDMYAEFAFLPLLRPDVLFLALPTLVLNLLSSQRIQWDIHYQYNAIVYALAFIGTIMAIATLCRWRFLTRRVSPTHLRLGLTGLVVLGNLLAYVWIGDPAWSWLKRGTVPDFTRNIAALIEQVPPDAPLAASNLIGPHVARREKLYFFPPRQEFYTDQALNLAEYILVDTSTDGKDPNLKTLETSDQWKLLAGDSRFMLFRRTAP